MSLNREDSRTTQLDSVQSPCRPTVRRARLRICLHSLSTTSIGSWCALISAVVGAWISRSRTAVARSSALTVRLHRLGNPGIDRYHADLIGGKGGTRTLDPGIMSAFLGSEVFDFTTFGQTAVAAKCLKVHPRAGENPADLPRARMYCREHASRACARCPGENLTSPGRLIALTTLGLLDVPRQRIPTRGGPKSCFWQISDPVHQVVEV